MPKHKSPSTLRSRAGHTSTKNRTQQEHSAPNAREAKKAKLREEFGLPLDTVFLFFRKRPRFISPPHRLYFGSVVCLDEKTHELLLAVRFLPQSPANREILASYNHAIPTLYLHARARGEVKNNGSMKRAQKSRNSRKKEGRMYATGFRPGYDHVARAGPYALNPATSANFALMEEDLRRQGDLPSIECFFGERFAGMSMFAFQSNAEIAAKGGVPSWAGKSFYVSPNAQVFASSIAVTFDEFSNAKHKDRDASKYAWGCNSRVIRKTGQLYERGADAPRGDVVGAQFVLDDYNIFVDLDACDGVVELLWCSQVNHHTSPSATFDAKKKQVAPSKAEVTRFACSCQISKALVKRIEQVNDIREGMDQDSWAKVHPTLLTTYGQELRKKKEKLAAKLGSKDDDLYC